MMTNAMRIGCTILLCLTLCACGCKAISRDRCSSGIREVFSDFEYAGQIHDLKDLNSVFIGHSVVAPKQFLPGTKYVFYHRRISSTYEFESSTIPSRLKAHGIEFKPLEPSDFGYPDEGGPLFTLELQGVCKGRIYNIIDRRIARDQKLSQVWASEAYIAELVSESKTVGSEGSN
jgi:hypothetical protein